MKKTFLLLGFLFQILLSFGQSVEQRQVDSVSKLVVRFINEKRSDKLYGLVGEDIKKQITPDTFRLIFTTTYFKLGGITKCDLESFKDNRAKYKVAYKVTSVYMFLKLDAYRKLEELHFYALDDRRAK